VPHGAIVFSDPILPLLASPGGVFCSATVGFTDLAGSVYLYLLLVILSLIWGIQVRRGPQLCFVVCLRLFLCFCPSSGRCVSGVWIGFFTCGLERWFIGLGVPIGVRYSQPQ